MVIENVRELRRERHLAKACTGRRQQRGGALDQRPRRRVGAVPGRGAANPDPRRRYRAVDLVRRPGNERAAQRRQVLDLAADDAERIEVVALQLDPAAAEFAEARLVADDTAEGGRADHRAAGL